MIVLNLKTYERSLEKALYFVDIASEVVEESGMRIVLCPPSIHLKDAAERFSEIFAQHCDASEPGQHTGDLPAEALKRIKVKGSIVNHSEKKLSLEAVKLISDRLHATGLESLVCAATLEEAEKIAHFVPTYIAVEPPELIGTGVSVSSARPDLITESVKHLEQVNDKIIVLCGAGVSNKEDVKRALDQGSKGVLLASAFVNAEDPKKFLQELVSAF